ncbi:hypothetical protein [Sphingomonas bacterium]|uniref:hypothetical protein n=1 Tax=Sphingomonas bacterium TaxID=1895847 RepID=UPI001574F524|nr:hypothetical protein [Sphingomonas bacterium]
MSQIILGAKEAFHPALAWAPIAIASVVGLGQTLQFFWQRQFNKDQSDRADRQLEVDVRKLQLDLLDRRLEVIAAIRAVLSSTVVGFLADADQRDSLFKSLLAGQTLFDAALAARLEQAWITDVAYTNARLGRSHIAGRAPISDAGVAANDETDRLRILLTDRLSDLERDMIDAARVARVAEI